MYAKSQKADLFFSGRYIRCIQCNGYPDLIHLIHSCAKSYQCFDIQLPGMDQTDRKIFNLPLQTHFISVCDIFQIQSFLKRKFHSKTADNSALFPHIKHICFQISGEDPFSICETYVFHYNASFMLDQPAHIRLCIRHIKILVKGDLASCMAFFS